MRMHNPPHPGEFLAMVYLEPNGLSARMFARKLGVSASTLSRILRGVSGISPEMALRLEKALGRSAESWLALQHNHDLWHAKRRVTLRDVTKVRLTAAYADGEPGSDRRRAPPRLGSRSGSRGRQHP
jgi:antitoxin HigA-1